MFEQNTQQNKFEVSSTTPNSLHVAILIMFINVTLYLLRYQKGRHQLEAMYNCQSNDSAAVVKFWMPIILK